MTEQRAASGQRSAGRRTKALALGVLCLSALTTAVDITITNIALPFIGRSLDAHISELQWTIDIYNLVLAGLLVLGGALADRMGRRRIFIWGYTLFGAASALAAFSPSIGLLVVARALMGVGAAGVTAPALAILASMYGPQQRARAIGAYAVSGASGLALGPIAGGLLLDHFWWGAVFLVNVPLVVVAVVVGRQTIVETYASPSLGGRGPLDVTGSVLSVVGLGGVLFGIIEGPNRGWSNPFVVAGLAGGAAVIAGFVRRELRARQPLFDVRILARPVVASGSLTLLMAYVLFTGFFFLHPQDLQDVHDESIVDVGLLFIPFATVFGACSLNVSRVLLRLGPRATISTGLAVSGAAATLFAATLDGPLWPPVVASMLLGIGLSMLITPPSTVVMNDVPETKSGDASSLNFVSRFAGAAIGVAVLGSVLASVYTRHVDRALVGLSSPDVASARGSLQGALEVAATLNRSAERALARSARDAFVSGATLAYTILAVLAFVAGVTVWVTMGKRSAPTRTQPPLTQQ